MEIYTSYFAKVKSLPKDIVPIAICGRIPFYWKGLWYKKVAPRVKFFTEWKMMGEYEYVLGLEPGNCLPDGRNVMRQRGILEILKPQEEKTHHLKFEFEER